MYKSCSRRVYVSENRKNKNNLYLPLHPSQVRRSIRDHFQGSRGLKLGYDIVTWAATQLAICYTVMPFLLLAVDSTLIYYRCAIHISNPFVLSFPSCCALGPLGSN